MKAIGRVALGASLISLLLGFLLARHFLDLGNQYSALTYVRTSLTKSWSYAPSDSLPAIGVKVEDKIVVMAKVESEDTDWVARQLPSFVTRPPFLLTDSLIY